MGNIYDGKRLRRAAVFFCLFCIIGLSAGCGRKEETQKELRLAFIAKDLEHYWFLQEREGMEKACAELGIHLECFDAGYADRQCIKYVRQVIDEEYDGLMICATSQELGPEIGELCGEAGIPVVAIDDSLKDQEGKEFPLVCMAYRQVGAIGGAALARLSENMQFPKESGRVHIMEVDVPNLSVFRERLTGYEDTLFSMLKLGKEDVTVISSQTGMYEENCQSVRSYFDRCPPDMDDYWIICGANDDCALACMHVLRQEGVSQEKIIACGLGGYELAIREFERGNTGYITVMTQPDAEGRQAVEMLNGFLTEGTELKDSVVLGGAVATCDNYMIYFGGDVK